MFSLFLIHVISLFNVYAMFILYKAFISGIQRKGYQFKPFIYWVKRRYIPIYLDILKMVVVIIIIMSVFSFIFRSWNTVMLFGIFGYIYLIACFLNITEDKNKKTLIHDNKLLVSKRFVRLMSFSGILSYLLFYNAASIIIYYFPGFYFLGITLLIAFVPLIILLSNLALYPIELVLNLYNFSKVKNKLSQRKDLTVIGVSGSYAKSTVKDILNTVLKYKYNVCVSPNSMNTIRGIYRTVVHDLTPNHKVLILELEPKSIIDARIISKNIELDYYINTGIDVSKLDYYENINNYKQILKEMLFTVRKKGSIIINNKTNIDKSFYADISKTFKGPKLKGINFGEDEHIPIKQITENLEHTDLRFAIGNDNFSIRTSLLGKMSAESVIMATYILNEMNTPHSIIEKAIKSDVIPLKGRMQALKTEAGIDIIDNSKHNSTEAFLKANDYISKLGFKKSTIITSGIDGLASIEGLQNMLLVESISKSFNKCVFIDNKITRKMYKFLLQEGFDKENVIFLDSVEKIDSYIKRLKSKDQIILINSV